MSILRIVIAQLNFLVGDIQGNLDKHIAAATIARDSYRADLIIFPELSLTGYPPEDLLFRKDFIESAAHSLELFKKRVMNIHCLIGHPQLTSEGLVNAASVIYNGKILAHYAKQHLPNYGIFDEPRYFVPGASTCVFAINHIPLGLVICEDLWQPLPVQQAVENGARIILSMNASPFELNKHQQRKALLQQRARENRVPIIYSNHHGCQDELIFDGGSMVVDGTGKLCQLAGFQTEVLHPVDIEISATECKIHRIPFHLPNEEENIYTALVRSVRDYIEKNHFPGALIAVSGGIDSALTLAIAVDAIGPHRVHAVFMPSRYSATMSAEDARALAKNLKVRFETISIEPVYKSFLDSLAPSFEGKKSDITEENIQSRCRAVILMALSNKSGHVVLTTGNYSEFAVGYTTIYGDMAGGFAVLKNVPKTLVYRLAHYCNQLSAVIPERSLTRAPSAELAANQKDEDSLPPYPILDQILELYLRQKKSRAEIISRGFDAAIVARVIQLIQRSEYKRRQAPVGPRLDHQSFGKDRRYPITCGYKD